MHSSRPGKTAADPCEIIFREEERFAREAALSLLVTRDLPFWRTMVPGMFLIDFLERGKMIRRIRSYYLPPRKAALEAAQSGGEESSGKEIPAEAMERIDGFLAPLQRYDGEARRILFRLVEALTDQYAALAAAGGNTFFDLVKNAYATADEFTTAEQQISRLESEWSAAVKSERGIAPIPDHHMAEFIARRQRRVEQIFSV